MADILSVQIDEIHLSVNEWKFRDEYLHNPFQPA